MCHSNDQLLLSTLASDFSMKIFNTCLYQEREHQNFLNPSLFLILCKDTKYKCDVLKLNFKKIKAINHDQNGLYSACNVAMGVMDDKKNDIRLKNCLRVN